MDHKLYTESDFTPEQVSASTPLAVAVVCDGLAVCRVCGRAGQELRVPCLNLRQRGALKAVWQGVETGLLPSAVCELRDGGLIASGNPDGFGRLTLTDGGREAVALLFL